MKVDLIGKLKVFRYMLIGALNTTEDMEDEFRSIYSTCLPFTLTSVERMYALYNSVKYIVNSKLEGEIVECGVWRGGSSMLAAITLKKYFSNKKIYLYDTYDGMSKPTKEDISFDGLDAKKKWGGEKSSKWCYASLDDVKANMDLTGYSSENLVFVKGLVEDTIPETMPDKISLLRLDTDFYESTKHELEHLFPKLVKGGVLILDDYGHWRGAKKAVDEYFAENNIRILLNRIDYTGRIGIKQ